MTAVNDFRPFAIGSGANVVTQDQYLALSSLNTGYTAGVAQSAQLNKTWRQSSFVASAIAQMMADVLNINIQDNGNTALFEQLLSAAVNLIDYGHDVGSPNAYQVAYAVSVTTLYDGLRLRFKATNANTGPSTFSPNGLTAQSVLNQSFNALSGGEIAVNGDCIVEWNSSLLSGSGAWVLVQNTGGASATSGYAPLASPAFSGTPTAPTQAQFDASTKLATDAFVARAMGAVAGMNTYASAQTLTAAADANKLVICTGAMTLPASATFSTAGNKIYFLSPSSTASLVCAGADTISVPGGTVTTLPLAAGDTADIMYTGSGWRLVGGSALATYSAGFKSGRAAFTSQQSVTVGTGSYLQNVLSFTAPCAGKILALCSTNITYDPSWNLYQQLYINGTLFGYDATKNGMTNSGVLAVSAGTSCTVLQNVSPPATAPAGAFSMDLSYIFVPAQ